MTVRSRYANMVLPVIPVPFCVTEHDSQVALCNITVVLLVLVMRNDT
jgi:hypothetical protein